MLGQEVKTMMNMGEVSHKLHKITGVGLFFVGCFMQPGVPHPRFPCRLICNGCRFRLLLVQARLLNPDAKKYLSTSGEIFGSADATADEPQDVHHTAQFGLSVPGRNDPANLESRAVSRWVRPELRLWTLRRTRDVFSDKRCLNVSHFPVHNQSASFPCDSAG